MGAYFVRTIGFYPDFTDIFKKKAVNLSGIAVKPGCD